MRRSHIIAGTVIAAALVIGGVGTAEAHQYYTGADIVNGSLTGADIKTNSVSGADIENGSLHVADLAPSAITYLKGNTGAKGATGAQGDKGDKGDAGTNGTNGTDGKDGKDGKDGNAAFAGAYYSVANYDSGDTNQGAIATVACKSTSDVAVSGGVQTLGLGGKATPVSSSFPGRMDWDSNTPKANRLDGWIVQFDGTVAPEKVKIWALCVPGISVDTQETFTESAG